MPTPPSPDFHHILKLVRRFIPKRLDRESIAQEIILHHLTQGASGSPTFTAIRNYCYSQLRRYRKELEVNQNTTHAKRLREKAQPGEDERNKHRVDLVNEIMTEAGLTSDQRELIFQHLYLDKPLKEISMRTAVPVYKVAQNYHHAVSVLREYCEKKGRKL